MCASGYLDLDILWHAGLQQQQKELDVPSFSVAMERSVEEENFQKQQFQSLATIRMTQLKNVM